VRGITNRSSGKMGYAVARAALHAGAKVTLISGPTSLAAPPRAKVVAVESAAEMFAVVKKYVRGADIFIGVAAVADYHVPRPSARKIPKSERGMSLRLETNPDILAWVAAQPRPPFCVGFAAESHDLNKHAEEKRRRKKLPLLAANLAQDAVGSDENELTIFDDDGVHKLARAPKTVIARQLIAHIAKLCKSAKSRKS
jgi:phosphopantothenoylcysteine decarboxylase/phosphopantothenate--cysteine ligase